MPDASVAADVHETLDVELCLATQITLDFVAIGDLLTDSCSLIICPILDLDVAIDPCSIQDASSTATTYTIYIGQGYLTSLVLRQIDADDSYCHTLYTV